MNVANPSYFRPIINSSKIGRAFLLRVLIFSSVMTLFLSGIQLYIEYKKDISQISEIRQQISKSYLKSIENAVWAINTEQIDALLEGITALPTVTEVRIKADNQADTLFKHSQIGFKKGDANTSVFTQKILSPTNNQRHVIGLLEVTQNSQFVYNNLKNRLLIVLSSNFVKTFLVALFILYVFQKLVARHLVTISDFLQTPSFFEDRKELTLDRAKNKGTTNDELDVFTQSFNSLCGQVKASWEEVEISEKRYRALVEGSLQGIIIVNKDWEFIYANKQAFHILEYEKDASFIKDLHDHFPNEIIPKNLQQLLTDNIFEPVSINEIKINTKKHGNKYVKAMFMLIKEENYEVIQIVFNDISNERELKKKEQDYELQLIQKNKMASIGTMLSGVTHEINNPNHIIKQNSVVLKETLNAIIPELHSYAANNPDTTFNNLTVSELMKIIPELIDDIHHGSDQITSIINDLKSFVRQDNSQDITRCCLNELIAEVKHTLRTQINKRCRHFELDLQASPSDIWCYKRRVSQVFINLIINALEAIKDPSEKIIIHTSNNKEGFITVRVRDYGTGIAVEDQHRIFDAFYSTKLDTGGTGLGLAISQSIATQHHTEIKINHEFEEGTEFTIEFPTDVKPMEVQLGIN
ncbi:ATP-binding protein [uncultured Cocleimonas sp.]|uniref:PAS domain-containing sensor histidine kinase n=1 Tax=uncultured Cocleimonas sp. TaxID=1051587 RepID=UPI00260B2DD3|nr:ATP-binding protein [uncultured Cocleimonas sp.]